MAFWIPLLLQVTMLLLIGVMLVALLVLIPEIRRNGGPVAVDSAALKKAQVSSPLVVDLKAPPGLFQSAGVDPGLLRAIGDGFDSLGKGLKEVASKPSSADTAITKIDGLDSSIKQLHERLYGEQGVSLISVQNQSLELEGRLANLESALVQLRRTGDRARREDVLVIAYNTEKLPVNRWRDAYMDVFKTRTSRYFPKSDYRLGLSFAQTAELIPIFRLSDGIDKVKADWKDFGAKSKPLPPATEDPSGIVGKLNDAFGSPEPDHPRDRRCVLIVSSECNVPKGWDQLNARVDVILLAPTEQTTISPVKAGEWANFCGSNGGVLRIIPKWNDGKSLTNELRRLTQSQTPDED